MNEDDYKTKKNDFISQSFIKIFLIYSENKPADIYDAYISFPVYVNPDNKGIDKFNILW